ncbi:MAG: hypothetical protein WAM85_07565 [Terracidiphilus sp.]
MKRKFLLSILAMIPAAFMPLAATGQIAPDKAPAAPTGPTFKYEVFAGWGYTSLNQVNQSRSGLQGVSLSVTRNWGKYFGITAQGGHYAWALTSSNSSVGQPTVDMYLVGPEFHAPLYDRIGILVHGLLGAAHTGGVTIQPSESFAGGVGMGLDYSLSPRLAVRLYGDDIGSSFTVTPFEPGDSPHRRFNARASIGVVYKF